MHVNGKNAFLKQFRDLEKYLRVEYERGDLPTGRTARRMHHPSVAVSPV